VRAGQCKAACRLSCPSLLGTRGAVSQSGVATRRGCWVRGRAGGALPVRLVTSKGCWPQLARRRRDGAARAAAAGAAAALPLPHALVGGWLDAVRGPAPARGLPVEACPPGLKPVLGAVPHLCPLRRPTLSAQPCAYLVAPFLYHRYVWAALSNLVLRLSWTHRLVGRLESFSAVAMAMALLEVSAALLPQPRK
jgi:hypothetical protein